MFNRFSGFVALVVAVILVVGFSSLYYVVQSLEGKNSNLKGQLVQQNEENAQLNQELVFTNAHVTALELQITPLQQEVNQKNSQIASLRESTDVASGKTLKAEEENATLQTQNTSLKQDLDQKDTEIAYLEKSQVVLHQEFKDLDTEVANLKEENAQLTKELSIKDAEIADLDQNLSAHAGAVTRYHFIAAQAMGALNFFIPEGGSVTVKYPESAIGDTTFVSRKSANAFDITMYPPLPWDTKGFVQTDGTIKWTFEFYLR